jgi:hypothetical protein
MLKDEACRGLYLIARVLGVTERCMRFSRLFHLLIAIRMAETVKVEGPNVKSRFIQSVAPRKTIEAMGYRVGGGECRAMHVKYGPSFGAG